MIAVESCQLKLVANCAGEAEVAFTAGDFAANTCVACGQEFQRKFPLRAADISIRPLAR